MKSKAWIEDQDAVPSPPSRGAWIEIMSGRTAFTGLAVAPLAGGVD